MNKTELSSYYIKEEWEMYLISIYFDEITDNKIRSYMKQIARYTGNPAMTEGNVPPHITISAFQTDSEEYAREIFHKIAEKCSTENIQWASIGCFLPHVIYLLPVLNEYLHQLAEINNRELAGRDNVSLNLRYQPFGWIPHTTLAKQLTKDQMKIAFEVMQSQFAPFTGRVVKIGLAKTNPYTDLEIWEM